MFTVETTWSSSVCGMANQQRTVFAPAGGVTVNAFLALKEAVSPCCLVVVAPAEAQPAAPAARTASRSGRFLCMASLPEVALEVVGDVDLDAVVETGSLADEFGVPVEDVDPELHGVPVEVERDVVDPVLVPAARADIGAHRVVLGGADRDGEGLVDLEAQLRPSALGADLVAGRVHALEDAAADVVEVAAAPPLALEVEGLGEGEVGVDAAGEAVEVVVGADGGRRVLPRPVDPA